MNTNQTELKSILMDMIWLKVLLNSCTVPYLIYQNLKAFLGNMIFQLLALLLCLTVLAPPARPGGDEGVTVIIVKLPPPSVTTGLAGFPLWAEARGGH